MPVYIGLSSNKHKAASILPKCDNEVDSPPLIRKYEIYSITSEGCSDRYWESNVEEALINIHNAPDIDFSRLYGNPKTTSLLLQQTFHIIHQICELPQGLLHRRRSAHVYAGTFKGIGRIIAASRV